MSLLSSRRQPGSLEPGDILGILTLDDPARVKHAKPFEGLLPETGTPNVVGNKAYQRLVHCLSVLGDILDGYDNQAIMATTFKDLIEVLHDPELPYSEISAILASLSGRIPAKLEESVRHTIEAAKAKGEQADFPAVRLKKTLEQFVQNSVQPQDRTMFRAANGALFSVVERFIGGLKGHETEVITDLLGQYEATEKLFGGSIEARVLALREQNKEDLDKVISLVFSHIKVQNKIKLALTLLEHIKSGSIAVNDAESRLYQVLQGLAALEQL